MISRQTMVDALSLLETGTHSDMDRFALRYEVEEWLTGSSKPDRVNSLIRYFIEDNLPKVEKDALLFQIIKELIDDEINRLENRGYGFYESESFAEKHKRLYNSLKKDGYTIEDGEFRRGLPEDNEIVSSENEIDRLLTKYNMITLKRHLEQAISNYYNSNWESANSQLRSFMEGLFNEMADQIDPVESARHNSENAKRNMLSQLNPPIIYRELNEFSDDGKNFINGVFKRIHRKGPHPGLSDLHDCTFRVQLVYLISAEMLRRFDEHMKNR